MSNAFNLSQLANFVDTSGKLNVSTGSTGTLPTTQGGTGLTTVGTNGQVLSSNGTTLSWTTPSSGGVTSLNGQTGAIDNTTQYAIGSYVMGRPANVTDYNNSTVAGSSLYNIITPYYNYVYEGNTNVGWSSYPAIQGNSQSIYSSISARLVNTGSWRCVSTSGNGATYSYGGTVAYPGLWVRYA
jgi:hypothetical protein